MPNETFQNAKDFAMGNATFGATHHGPVMYFANSYADNAKHNSIVASPGSSAVMYVDTSPSGPSQASTPAPPAVQSREISNYSDTGYSTSSMDTPWAPSQTQTHQNQAQYTPPQGQQIYVAPPLENRSSRTSGSSNPEGSFTLNRVPAPSGPQSTEAPQSEPSIPSVGAPRPAGDAQPRTSSEAKEAPDAVQDTDNQDHVESKKKKKFWQWRKPAFGSPKRKGKELAK